MFVGIDGTGPGDDKKYVEEMSASFVKQLADEIEQRQPPTMYHRGPSLLSIGRSWTGDWFTFSQVRDLARLAVQFVRKHADEPGPVVLAGYSRGGAAAIQAARILSKEAPQLTIDCLALFDAVDRDLTADVATIPGNVTVAYHAMRDPEIGSRWYFGNCGKSIELPGMMFSLTFQATHAAMGGMPWTGDHPTRTEVAPGFDFQTFALGRERGFGPPPPMVTVPTITKSQDEQASRDVGRWMWGHLRKHVPLA